MSRNIETLIREYDEKFNKYYEDDNDSDNDAVFYASDIAQLGELSKDANGKIDPFELCVNALKTGFIIGKTTALESQQ